MRKIIYEIKCVDPYNSDEAPEEWTTCISNWFKRREFLKRMKTLYRKITVSVHKTVKEDTKCQRM